MKKVNKSLSFYCAFWIQSCCGSTREYKCRVCGRWKVFASAASFGQVSGWLACLGHWQFPSHVCFPEHGKFRVSTRRLFALTAREKLICICRYRDGFSINKFVQDLKSGKLHREFHNGPDPVEVTPKPNLEEIHNAVHLPKDLGSDENKRQVPADPPESAFRKLQPSNNRYTILKDEF